MPKKPKANIYTKTGTRKCKISMRFENFSTTFVRNSCSTIEYLGEWEMLYNPNFNCTEFGTFRNMAASNNFVLSVKTWIETTNAIGIFSKAMAW
jgi:hypothetical protein